MPAGYFRRHPADDEVTSCLQQPDAQAVNTLRQPKIMPLAKTITEKC